MVHRLVLGCGAVGFDLLSAMPRHGDLTVITADAVRAESLREADIDATQGDPTAPDDHISTPVDIVVVAGEDAERNFRAAEAAREAFPDALLVAYTGIDAEETAAAALDSFVDRTIDPVAALAGRVLDYATGPESERARGLKQALLNVAEPLAVVAHDNPDPDAIASAVALCRVAESFGVEAAACYSGEISHQENRALVNLLDLPMVHLGPGDIEAYGAIALVDHSRPGVNDSLPEDSDIDIVIDHHPPRGPVDGVFIDLRSEVGSTSTLLTQYLDWFDVPFDRKTATSLLYGIQVDTKEFTREVAEADFIAASLLIPAVDSDTLSRIESPSVSIETLSVLAAAIKHRTVQGGALSSCVGEIRDRDALAQAAERLLDMEAIHTTLVYGFMDETIYVSGRSRGGDLDLGETLRDAFGAIGDAGGHADMAGAQIPLGILGEVGAELTGSLGDVIEAVVEGRFFEALGDAPSAPTAENSIEYEYAPVGTASLSFAERVASAADVDFSDSTSEEDADEDA
ncbi:phosphoesterase RecJ domain protein [halophilic archaeon DL31]|jgi:nanoRNase/pAp phosphatase (c-di-AMP/oligoRNAs hydrolase)|nr:phosphoesterase RecJ domain protein [halophilic archaeon DL31]